ncbi:MAG: hypothetical protein ACRCU2_17695 [Planktothrix sp.]
MLSNELAGQTMTMKQVDEGHNVGKRYSKANYKEALKQLYSASHLHEVQTLTPNPSPRTGEGL